MSTSFELNRPRSTGLVDVLDRVLDKGLFVGGDIKISLAEVELLTIRIRLIVCSLDKAREMGLDWWAYDAHLSPGKSASAELVGLRERVRQLEQQLQVQAVRAGMRPPSTVRTPPAATRRRRS
jgi:Gas vesicle protein